MAYALTKKALVLDLYVAFYCAKKHKSGRSYVLHFEHNLKRNIEQMAEELFARSYHPKPSSCFIIEYPKKREVFAAQFRDRIVHHLYFNYVHEMFERTFIQDTYSCIKGRGTHYGIERLRHHIRSESRNYTIPCYGLKLDKRGYFMHIDRSRLLKIATDSINKMSSKKVSKYSNVLWRDVIDVDFVLWLTEKIVTLDPQSNCRVVGKEEDWVGLDPAKRLLYAPKGCGLPIGNLTSQLLSNVYLNVFDQFMKRTLKCRHYGRYVDDSYVISTDKQWLQSLIPHIRSFLWEQLGLELHMGKLIIVDVRKGMEFLGAFVKPYVTYISNASLNRIVYNINNYKSKDKSKIFHRTNSYLGVMSHYATFNIRCRLFLNEETLSVAPFDRNILKMRTPKK